MHKKTFILGTSILLIICALFIDLHAQVRVKGYYRKDGTYVSPHIRSRPDGNPYNNYSFPGNYNPNTGKISTGNPETYLNNYYNPGSSFYSIGSTTSHYSHRNTSNYNTDASTPTSVNSRPVALTKRINNNHGYDIDIKQLNELINSLQKLKAKISSTNKTSNSSSNKTEFKGISNQRSSSSIRHGSKKTTYLIIAYSETTRERAEARAKQIQSHYILNRYQIKVLRAVVNGRVWYRVALGDFGTYSEVKEKLSLLSTSIPSDSWILKK